LPVDMPVADATLVYATAQPLMHWQDGQVTRLIMSRLPGIKTQFKFTGINEPGIENGQIRRMTTQNGAKIEMLVLSEEDSLNTWKINIAGRRHIAVCPIELWQDGNSLKLRSRQSDSAVLRIYPPTEQKFIYQGKSIALKKKGEFSVYTLPARQLPQVSVTFQANAEIPAADRNYPFRKEDAPPQAWRIRFSDIDWNLLSDVLVRFEYIGDTARLYLNGLLVADNFWSKTDWEVGIKRWKKELAGPVAELVLVISPWQKGQEVFVQKRPDVTEDLTAKLLGINALPEQTFILESR
jgi:beta-galactosidase